MPCPYNDREQFWSPAGKELVQAENVIVFNLAICLPFLVLKCFFLFQTIKGSGSLSNNDSIIFCKLD